VSRIPIFDGHNDTLLNLHLPERGGGRSLFERSDTGHVDLPRAREGGFGGGFFAVHMPTPQETWSEEDELSLTGAGYEVSLSPPIERSYALRVAFALTARLFRLEEESGGGLRVIRDADELADCLQNGTLAAILHFEGAEAIDEELEALEVFYRAGLRSLGLVWSRPNAFACGVPFAFPRSPDTGPGLTEAGRRLVRECNRLGVLVDLSHITERGFWDVAGLTEAPLVATHSNAYALCPTTRNLTDRQLDAIRDSDGMVGVNFAVAFLREDGREEADTPLETVARHVDYLVERLGEDRVGFGSDFDGATVPQELGDASGLPKLMQTLKDRGYDEPLLRKLAHENWLRVLRATWRQ
jgi:membrane dipeptidase